MSAKTLKICVTAMGIALFVALSVGLQVPVFENYYLCLGYLVMAVFCWSFGPLQGTAVGVLGVVMYCLVINGMRGLPGWAVGNAVIGTALGTAFKATKGMKSRAAGAAVNTAAIIVSVAAGILGVKSLVECLLYSQPFAIRVAKNAYAFVADAVMLIISLPFAMMMDGRIRKLLPKLFEE